MARHLVPIREEHDLTLDCVCRPQVGFAVVVGSKVATVRHRPFHEAAGTVTHPRTDEHSSDDGEGGS